MRNGTTTFFSLKEIILELQLICFGVSGKNNDERVNKLKSRNTGMTQIKFIWNKSHDP